MANAPKNKFTAGEGSLGRNTKYKLDDKGVLTITVDLNAEQGPSSSGKSTILGSTDGNAAIPGGAGAVAGINVYKKISK